jgi:hypothetical protein
MKCAYLKTWHIFTIVFPTDKTGYVAGGYINQITELMKKGPFIWIMLLLVSATIPSMAQNRLVINDISSFLNENIETTLRNRLAEDSIELSSVLDMRRRCEYWLASLAVQENGLQITVTGCNDVVAGTKNIGTRVLLAADQEKALLIYFALSEIFANPYKEAEVAEPVIVKETPQPEAPRQEEPSGRLIPDPGQHRSRYFFAPSSYSLDPGELYYNTLYFFVHDFQYGISEQFSLGMGTTIAGFPFYLTPKLTFPIDETSAVAVGDLMMIGTWGSNFFGNLLYTTYSRGGAHNNFTIGGGHLYVNDSEMTGSSNSLVFNFSSLFQVSDHIYFLTENYISQIKTKQDAWYDNYNQFTGEYIYYNETFDQKMFFIYGMAGFRFINRVKDVVSWQFGLTYLFSSFGDIPYKYYGSYWNTSAQKGGKFVTFPVVGFARKFATKF